MVKPVSRTLVHHRRERQVIDPLKEIGGGFVLQSVLRDVAQIGSAEERIQRAGAGMPRLSFATGHQSAELFSSSGSARRVEESGPDRIRLNA